MLRWFPFCLSVLLAAGASAQDRTCWLRDGVSPAKSTVYLLCEQGSFLVTTDGGATWATRDIKATGHLRSIDFIDTEHGFAVGDGGLLAITSDAGKSWQPLKTDLKENLAAIQFIGQQGWIAGYDGVILHSADGGKTWTPQTTGTKESLESIFFLDANLGWAVGWAGTIVRTADGGKTWQLVKSDAATWSLSGVYFKDAKNGWAVGFAGSILRTHDGGATWQSLKSPSSAWLTAIAFDKANRGWVTADDSILSSEDGGETWKSMAVTDRLFLSQFVPVEGSLWAIGQLGVLRQSGAKWERLASLVVDDPSRDTSAPTPTTSKPN